MNASKSNGVDGPLRSPSTRQARELRSPDLNLDGALCWRALATGGAQPTDQLPSPAQQRAARLGVAEVRAGGDLGGKPALILHGRKDALIAPNHSSRTYFGLNQTVEGSESRARYIEVANSNHFDSFIPLYPGLDAPGETLVAMHGYFNHAVRRCCGIWTAEAACRRARSSRPRRKPARCPFSRPPRTASVSGTGALIIPAGGVPSGCAP